MAANKDSSNSKYDGGIGLALSGGGFRASFFHIGVLARLAECDMLRDIVAISTVSGGSIVGALYYLHLKRLFESKNDEDITPEDYVQIVSTIEKDFLKSAQKNLRMRTFYNPWKNLKMFKKGYSRSDRIGELYDEYFYQGILKNRTETGMIKMPELLIDPICWKGDGRFNPIDHNETRKNTKVPVLLINSTVLNDGHDWVFEAKTMGEPLHDSPAFREIDKNWRLCRPDSYADTLNHKKVKLGKAVAASACVSGVFSPLPISDMYEEDIRVELVDGGVYDNQGIQSLEDRGCSDFIVSDASFSMINIKSPSTSAFSVICRANLILMDRVRELQLLPHIKCKNTDMHLMHLRKELPPVSIMWRADAKSDCHCDTTLNTDNTSYGVNPEAQDRISRIRTDLDAYHNVEAYSLMMDGYKMTKQGLKAKKCTDHPVGWNFTSINSRMENPDPYYLKLLKVSAETFFKAFMLSRRLKLTAGTIAALLGALILALIIIYSEVTISLGQLAIGIVLLLILALPSLGRMLPFLEGPFRPITLLRTILIQFTLAVTGSITVFIALKWIDPIYLEKGNGQDKTDRDT